MFVKKRSDDKGLYISPFFIGGYMAFIMIIYYILTGGLEI